MIKRIKLRWGKGSPLFKVNGIANADARETTPLMPAQPTTSGNFQPGLFSFVLIFLDRIRGKYSERYTRTIRNTITIALIIRA
ncbi:hypothetical protein D3C87_1518670 [compost metagenome]